MFLPERRLFAAYVSANEVLSAMIFAERRVPRSVRTGVALPQFSDVPRPAKVMGPHRDANTGRHVVASLRLLGELRSQV